jgi:glyoxylase-like metal-dependent hydrolase (beta-lactamase superfamily II)
MRRGGRDSMPEDPFDRDWQAPTGIAETLAPGLRRVLAPNPSAMTFRGTNTYLLGARALAVIDPGPDDDAHLAALRHAIGDAGVSHILVTHAHRDHSALASRLAATTGAPVLAFGGPTAGRRRDMAALATSGDLGGGEGVDTGFLPDIRLGDGEVVAGADWTLQALHTPGHFGNHLCFAWGDAVFTGDTAMGWATTLISPPDGDLTDFMASLTRLAARRDRVWYPGHGGPVTDPAGMAAWQIAHRHARSDQVRAALATGPATPAAIADRLYAGMPPALIAAGARNVLAHLIDLSRQGAVRSAGAPGPDTRFALAGSDKMPLDLGAGGC